MTELIRVVQRYQRYNFQTGAFDVDRTAEEFCAVLGDVYPSMLSRFYNGKTSKPWRLIQSFLRTFPGAAQEVAAAMAQPVAVRSEPEEEPFPDIPYLATA